MMGTKVENETASSSERNLHNTVLCAHGGNDNDFQMILSNMERYEMPLSLLENLNMKFADTYIFCRQLRGDGVKILQGTQLSQAALYQKLFPDQKYKYQHQAMADVDTMLKLFIRSPLKAFLQHLPISELSDRIAQYQELSTKKLEERLMNENLPKMSLAAHAMTSARLLRSGLTYSRMQAFFESCTSFMDFFDKLKDMGITRSSAKSIALKLDGMGLRCRGIDESIESNYKCFDQVEDDGNDTTPLQRSDSGYSSGTPSSPPVELPESLFFPTNDKILFGEFTEEELEFNDELEALETTCKTLSVNDTAFDTKTSTSLEQWGDIFCESEMYSQGTQCTAADESNGKPDIYFGDFDSCVEEDSSGVDFNDFHSDKDNVITELCSPAVSDVPAAEAGNSEKTGLAVCEDGGIDQMEEELWEVDDSAAGFQISFKKSIPLSLTLDDFSNRKGIKNFRTCGVTPVMVEETRLSTYSNRKRREKKKKLAKQTVEQRIKAWDKIVPTKVKVDENILNLRRCVLDAASKAIA